MKAQPAPMVSGRYFFPNAPLLCLKRIPACAVTSVNSIGPVGRGAVGVGVGEGDAVATSPCGAVTGVSGFLQEMMKNAISNISTEVRIGIFIWCLGIQYIKAL